MPPLNRAISPGSPAVRDKVFKRPMSGADEETRDAFRFWTMSSSSKAIAAGALLILICIGALSFWSEVRNEKDRQWVTHTLLVVQKTQAIRIDITQAESGQWGYLLTGEDRYLEPYRAGLEQLRVDMRELREMTSDNPTQREAMLRLGPLIASRLDELSGGIEVRRHSGLLPGVEAVAYGNTGGKWMGQIGALLGEMRDTEETLLNGRLTAAAASTRKMKIVIVCGNGLAILILLVKGFVIHRETMRRNRAERNLRHANERLERRTSELSETNTELESFAYSVAHDLRAPLRHIAGYSNVLAQDYAPHLDVEGRRLLSKIVDGAQKMGQLVDDLLSLSKIGLQHLALEATPLDALLLQAMEELAPGYSEREIEWRIAELFSAECDPGLIKQVFVNLLSNAIKYTGKRAHAVIEVGWITQNEKRTIFVRDNGAGFEMQYVDKLFGVFQRLHKAREFEGTGVGLAIVQRIIRKHGGRIWAEAALDRGAAFFFTLGSPEIAPASELNPKIKEQVMHV
jgi:signal transduction histidine kinase